MAEKLTVKGEPARLSLPPPEAAKQIREYLNQFSEGRDIPGYAADRLRELADNLPTQWRLPTGRSENKVRAIAALLNKAKLYPLPAATDLTVCRNRYTQLHRLLVAIELITRGKKAEQIEEADYDEEEE